MRMRFATLPTLLVAGLMFAGPLPIATPTAEAASLASLDGAWRGGGKLRLKGGKSERLRCRAYYNSKGGGKRLGMAVRCASPSYKIELRSQLAVAGSRVTGNWEERNFNATGSLFGSSRPGRLTLSVSGSVKATLFVTYSGRRQNLRLSGKVGSFRGLTLAFRK